MVPNRQFADDPLESGAPVDRESLSRDPDIPDGGLVPAPRRRRRRRRRLTRRVRLVRAFIVAPLVVVLLWATVSYTVWMLRPTSLSWSVNSVEWVRYEVPFGIGNWAADHVEQIYYSSQAPKKISSEPKILGDLPNDIRLLPSSQAPKMSSPK